MDMEDMMLGMGPSDMVDAVCRGLQNNDASPNNAGMSRLYRFATPQGRCYMAPPPPRGGMVEGVTQEFFLDNACDPVMALVGCESYTIIEVTEVPGHQTRGGLGTVKVRLESNLHSYLDSQRCFRSEGSVGAGRGTPVVRVPLGTGDRALQALVDIEEKEEAGGVAVEDADPEDALSGLTARRAAARTKVAPQSRTLLFGLEQQRRPPLEGVWLIKEVLPLEQTLFQVRQTEALP